jgi:hypothetical protein
MSYVRNLWFRFRLRRRARAQGYGAEVLFANWVELPAAFREIIARR